MKTNQFPKEFKKLEISNFDKGEVIGVRYSEELIKD